MFMFWLEMFVEFISFYLLILVFGYLLPAGQFYYVYHVRDREKYAERRIQARLPAPESIRREVRLSLVTILIFALLSTVVFQFYKDGDTALYWNVFDYPLWYLPVSFVLCLVIHDTYFYWTHRLMHWRPIFKYCHQGHHRSLTPTPWAIFAFQPLEAVIQFAGVALIIFYLPLHPFVLFAYLSIDSFINTAGHTGFEMVPPSVARHWLFRGWNTVTHHDLHHTNVRVNYGAFFNVWDRLMGTFLDDSAAKEGARSEQHDGATPTSTPAERTAP
ncbi:MAG: sterol desaturase family protein [Planctomycetota bacterium]